VSASLLPAAGTAATLSGTGALGVVTGIRLIQIMAAATAERYRRVTPL